MTPGRYFELMPYAFGQARFQPAEPGNPFRTGTKLFGNAGLDLKLGLKSNLTLDATVNPDFGQVEVDPAVVNLSAFETYYRGEAAVLHRGRGHLQRFRPGRRQGDFGFNWPIPTSSTAAASAARRRASHAGDGFAASPTATTILGAAKLSGKIGRLEARRAHRRDRPRIRRHRRRRPALQARRSSRSPGTAWCARQKEFAEGRHGLGFMPPACCAT